MITNLSFCLQQSLPGDVLITAGFISYVGYFTKQYRTEMLDGMWIPFLLNQTNPFVISDALDPIQMLVNDAVVATWENEGLPSDRMSVENATILTVCERWPLMVDPQLQGVKWIKRRYGSDLKVSCTWCLSIVLFNQCIICLRNYEICKYGQYSFLVSSVILLYWDKRIGLHHHYFWATNFDKGTVVVVIELNE